MTNNISINNMIITSVDYIMGLNRVTGILEAYVDQLDNINISNSEDESEITGKNGAILKKIKKNKSVEVTGENGLWNASLMSAQTGSDPVSNDKTVVHMLEYIEVNNGVAKLSKTPVGDTGNEISTLYVVSDNGDFISQQKYTQSADNTKVSAGDSAVFYYNQSDNAIQVATTGTYAVADGTLIAVSYDIETNATTVSNYSDVFGKTLDTWIYLTATDTCDRTYKCAIHMPRGQFSGSFDIDVSGDQVMQDFTITNLVDTCGTTSINKLWDFIVFSDED